MLIIDLMYQLIENGPYTQSIQHDIIIEFCQNNIDTYTNPDQGQILLLSTLCHIVNDEKVIPDQDNYLYFKACRIIGFICDVTHTIYSHRPPLITEYIVNNISIANILNNSFFGIKYMILWTILQIIKLYDEQEITIYLIPLILTTEYTKKSLIFIIMEEFSDYSKMTIDYTHSHEDDTFSSSAKMLSLILQKEYYNSHIARNILKHGIIEMIYNRIQNIQIHLKKTNRLPSIIHHEMDLRIFIKSFMIPEYCMSETDIINLRNMLINLKLIQTHYVNIQYMYQIGMSTELINYIFHFGNVILEKIITKQACKTIKQISKQYPIFAVCLPQQISDDIQGILQNEESSFKRSNTIWTLFSNLQQQFQYNFKKLEENHKNIKTPKSIINQVNQICEQYKTLISNENANIQINSLITKFQQCLKMISTIHPISRSFIKFNDTLHQNTIKISNNWQKEIALQCIKMLNQLCTISSIDEISQAMGNKTENTVTRFLQGDLKNVIFNIDQEPQFNNNHCPKFATKIELNLVWECCTKICNHLKQLIENNKHTQCTRSRSRYIKCNQVLSQYGKLIISMRNLNSNWRLLTKLQHYFLSDKNCSYNTQKINDLMFNEINIIHQNYKKLKYYQTINKQINVEQLNNQNKKRIMAFQCREVFKSLTLLFTLKQIREAVKKIEFFILHKMYISDLFILMMFY